MGIEHSIRGVVDFANRNDELLELVKDTSRDAMSVLSDLFDRLEANREEARELVELLGSIEFQVAGNDGLRQRQKQLLEKIKRTRKEVREFRSDPELSALLYADLGKLRLALGNTYTELVGQMIAFTPDEIDDFRQLLSRATLDTAQRQSWLDIKDGFVSLAKLGLGLATRLA